MQMLTTAEGLMTQGDRVTPDGLQEVFQTNLFGHFILVGCFDLAYVSFIWVLVRRQHKAARGNLSLYPRSMLCI